MSSETERKYKAFVTPALAGYVATVIGVYMIIWNNLSTRVWLEAVTIAIPGGCYSSQNIREIGKKSLKYTKIAFPEDLR
jgi:hypothetical protein